MKSFTRTFSVLSALLLAFCIHNTLAQQLPQGTPLPRTGWTVTADSSNADAQPSNVLDGDSNSIWHTQWQPSAAPLPHWIRLDMGASQIINGISIQPRQDASNNGNIGSHEIAVSVDAVNWVTVAYGTYLNDKSIKRTFFTQKVARYVQISVSSEAQDPNNPWTTIAELNVYGPWGNPAVASFVEVPSQTKGRWASTIDLPLVPVAAALSKDNKLVMWSAYRSDNYTQALQGYTQTVQWTFATGAQSAYTVTNTQHDMFCPGISTDFNGQIVVTGGNDNQKTSGYIPATSAWQTDAQMTIGRGYQASTTISDGRIFTIGGSWSGGYGNKNGEIYNSTSNVWTALPGCQESRILTNDTAGIFRSDNHAWLFAWKGNSIFHAGPSKQMNWFGVTGTGTNTSAGLRAADDHSMNGIAVMYDAVAGKVLTAGGAVDYQEKNATTNVHIITLGAANTIPNVVKIASMAYPRAFHTATVLPNGQILVSGGQAYPIPFAENDSQFFSEIWTPSTQTWTTIGQIAMPRNYHSTSILLPDATVANGGSGLCGFDCKENHMNFQVYMPAYLFDANGNQATRPQISAVSSTVCRVGQTIGVTTDVAATFALIRYGSSTHTVNTDQRRVPLTGTRLNGVTTLILPTDPGVLLPGYWMLFAMNAAGVPSVATTIQITL